METFWTPWKAFLSDLWLRVYAPVGQPTLIFYFVAITVAVGGIGVWISLPGVLISCPSPTNQISFLNSLSTYLLAVLAAAFADFILGVRKKRSSMQMFAMFVFTIGTLAAVISRFITSTNMSYARSAAIVAAVLAFFLWWIANADNIRLSEGMPRIDSAMGGNADDNLKGEIKGFKVE